MRTGFIWLRMFLMTGSCEKGKQCLNSVKGGKFADYMRDCFLIKKIYVYPVFSNRNILLKFVKSRLYLST